MGKLGHYPKDNDEWKETLFLADSRLFAIRRSLFARTVIPSEDVSPGPVVCASNLGSRHFWQVPFTADPSTSPPPDPQKAAGRQNGRALRSG